MSLISVTDQWRRVILRVPVYRCGHEGLPYRKGPVRAVAWLHSLCCSLRYWATLDKYDQRKLQKAYPNLILFVGDVREFLFPCDNANPGNFLSYFLLLLKNPGSFYYGWMKRYQPRYATSFQHRPISFLHSSTTASLSGTLTSILQSSFKEESVCFEQALSEINLTLKKKGKMRK